MGTSEAILILCLVALSSGQQRVAPGVPPNQYQGGQQIRPPPPPQGQQYQAGAPGVPPQQYQQAPTVPPPQQQQYQQQQQFQQPQQQQQQFQQPQQQQQQFQQPQQQQQQFQQPQQQQQQFQQPQQPQQQFQQPQQQQQPHQHHQGAGHNQRVLHNTNLGKERDHIKEHLEVPIDTAGMSEQELQYHYFKMHDADNNNQLDGQELIKSLFHWHDSSNHDAAKTGGHPPPDNKLFTDDELVAMIDPILDQDDRNKDGFIDYPEFVQAQRNAAAAAAAAGTNAV